MTRIERRQRRKRQIIRRVCAGACALAFLASCCLVLTRWRAAREAQPEPAEATEPPAPVEQPTEQPTEVEAIDPLKADREALARMVWGEARGCSTTEQAAVVWCVLNRFDSDDPYYANCMTLYDIVTQPLQFVGYDPDNPLEPAIQAVVDDVLARWMAEKVCVGNVGRVLPAEYLFFTGDGKTNTFRDQYQGGNIWDWTLDSPYEE